MSNYQKSDYELTQVDKRNWWDFLERNYPKNLECANQYYSDVDEDLEEIGCTPGNFDINDYFTICQLPRITAANGVIKVNGEVVEHYDTDEDI